MFSARQGSCGSRPLSPPTAHRRILTTSTTGQTIRKGGTQSHGSTAVPGIAGLPNGVVHSLLDRKGTVMVNRIAQFVLGFLEKEDGPTAVEYAVMLALIIVVCIAAITALGQNTMATFSNVGSVVGSASRGLVVSRTPRWVAGPDRCHHRTHRGAER